MSPKNSVVIIAAVTLAFLLLSTSGYSQSKYARFPDDRSVSSPDGRYILINVDSGREPNHYSILLKDKTAGKTSKIYEYGRSATAVWAPDSRHFAINDYAGSDFTNTYIIAVDGITPRIDLQKEISQQIDLPGGDHEYFGVARWLDERRVVVHHWGHDSDRRSEFCGCYTYTLNGRVERCAKQPRNNCEELTP